MGLFKNLATVHGATLMIAVILIVILMIVLIKIFNIDILGLVIKSLNKLMKFTGRGINKSEKRYHRDLAIGKVTEKRAKVKTYRFLNDLIIDLGLKSRGATPFEFLLMVFTSSIVVSLLGCEIIFGNMILGIIMLPMVFAGLMCGLYTKANIAHDSRIEAVIEAENIVSNGIRDGVVVSIRNSIETIPQVIRQDFRDFLDNIEHKNYHIRTALQELNNNLGSVSDEFIKKCIVFEMEEEHGIVGIFKDVVEINNIKTEMRTEMKRKFEEVTTEFVIGSLMIFTFLGGTIAIFDNIANFYFKTIVGQLIVAADALIVIGEFVYITYLRAKEL